MTDEKAIEMLQRNRDANLNKPKFVEACNKAITAMTENKQLKNRCFIWSQGVTCMFCGMECEHRRTK